MIQVNSQTRILVAVEPVDFRMGIDGLGRLCRALLGEDPFSGKVFVFRNRRRTAVKVLFYDGQGFWLCQKRLSKGVFQHWPTHSGADATAAKLLSHQLHVLLAGGDPASYIPAPQWRSVA